VRERLLGLVGEAAVRGGPERPVNLAPADRPPAGPGERPGARGVWQPVLDTAPESDLARQIRAALAGQTR